MSIISVSQDFHGNAASQHVPTNVLNSFEDVTAPPTTFKKVAYSPQYSHELKKATRILRDLAKDLSRKQTQTLTPSTWLLKCLIHSHFCTQPNTNWQITMSWTLTNIAQCATLQNHMEDSFVELDGVTSLFPNSEGFSLEDTRVFATTLLTYLASQTTNSQ